ncbi:MAG: c-type cytochrome [Alphaproteobacteria bacterium]|nr:c-type cytochrome [Alphaproteobacteria bacterium]
MPRFVVFFALAACIEPHDRIDPVPPAQQPAERVVPGQSSATVAADAQGRVYNVNPDPGTITRTDPMTGEVLEVAVGVEPSRLAIRGDDLYVTLRGERALVRLDLERLASGPQEWVEVGAEPMGVVVSDDGSAIYVALSMEDTVVEILRDRMAIERVFENPGEPRSLALHPAGRFLYVGLKRGTGLNVVDLRTGMATTLVLPRVSRASTPDRPLHTRVTGDLAVNGSTLYVPALHVDTQTPIRVVSSVEEIGSFEPEANGEIVIDGGAYGGIVSSLDPIDRVTPSVVAMPLGVDGMALEAGRAFIASAIVGEDAPQLVSSYISSVTPSADGTYVIATMQASEAALWMSVTPESTGSRLVVVTPDGLDASPTEILGLAGFHIPQAAAMAAGSGVDGAVLVNGRAFANAAFTGRIVELGVDGARATLEDADPAELTGSIVPRERFWTVSESPLSPEVQQGRELFHMARDPMMGGTGVSCSTCHFDGRNDGLTWTFESGPRQTPSLAGVVSETAPVTWTEQVPSIQDEAQITAMARLGGRGLNAQQLDAVAAFIDWTRIPDTPDPDAAAVARGAVHFVQSGCATCHSGPRHTDGQLHEIAGLALDTPTLTGIAGSAPYLHDGSAPSLRAVIERARTPEFMGSTAHLDEAGMDDLEAYLRSL